MEPKDFISFAPFNDIITRKSELPDILYYRANTASKTMTNINDRFRVNNIYNVDDNYDLKPLAVWLPLITFVLLQSVPI